MSAKGRPGRLSAQMSRGAQSEGNPMNAPEPNDLPLSGIRVIDFTQVMLGPVCTQMLGDYGADVIKIERKGAGDLSRTTFEPVAGHDNPVFCSLNRNKRSVALDLKSPNHLVAVRALIANADVVVNNFRAGVMERIGLGYDDCRRMNPRIIYAVGTGFGETGPYAHKGGQDVLAQAMSGVMARRADDALPLSIYATTFADYSAGMHLVQGILLALLQRARTGEGQKVSVSLYNSMLAAQMQEAAICMALEIPDLSSESRFATLEEQIKHKRELQTVFRERYRTNTTAHWLSRLEAQDLLCAPVRNLREALADSQTAHNEMVLDGYDGEQAMRVIGSPIRMSRAPVGMRRTPPRLGEHTEEVLAEVRAVAAANVGQ